MSDCVECTKAEHGMPVTACHEDEPTRAWIRIRRQGESVDDPCPSFDSRMFFERSVETAALTATSITISTFTVEARGRTFEVPQLGTSGIAAAVLALYALDDPRVDAVLRAFSIQIEEEPLFPEEDAQSG